MFDYVQYIYQINFGQNKYFYKIIKRVFGLYPHNIELYKLALIHKSASIVLEDGTQMNNERLEYLGDAVIEAVTSDMLYVEFPYEDEGFLTKMRSKIVSRSSLNSISQQMGLDSYIISHSNLSSKRKHLGGDAFEAMIGAIYLDKGFDFTNRLLINSIYKKYIDIEKVQQIETDFKSRMIEWCQKNKISLTISSKQGEHFTDRSPQFVSVFVVDGEEKGYGVGSSKKEAEQRAANNSAKALGLDFND